MIAASDAVSVTGLAEIPDSLNPSGMSCCFDVRSTSISPRATLTNARRGEASASLAGAPAIEYRGVLGGHD